MPRLTRGAVMVPGPTKADFDAMRELFTRHPLKPRACDILIDDEGLYELGMSATEVANFRQVQEEQHA